MTQKRIGIVGGGQLGRMLAQAAQRLGFFVMVLDPTSNSPAGQIANQQLVGSFQDPVAIKRLAQSVDFLTFEIESANAEALQELLGKAVVIHPSPDTLALIKDKLQQKQFLRKHNIPVADFIAVDSLDDALRVGQEFGYPYILKSRFGGYDGRGNFTVMSEQYAQTGFEQLGEELLYAERMVSFAKELAVIAARGVSGEIKVYPVVETIQKNHICHEVIAPAQVPPEIAGQAEKLAQEVLENLNGVGVFGIEMFLTESNEVLVNEIAPRVHNSGHFSIEACHTSQFEQHIRAITGMPLGDPSMKVPAAVMINILGNRSNVAQPQGVEAAEAIEGVKVHIYGKMEVRQERKMGHLTAVGDSVDQALERAQKAKELISI